MTCRELASLATEYAEGALPLPDRLRARRHLRACGDCRAYLRQMRAVALALAMLPPPAIPPGARAELRLRFERWRRR